MFKNEFRGNENSVMNEWQYTMIRNDCIHRKLEIAPIEDKIGDNQLR